MRRLQWGVLFGLIVMIGFTASMHGSAQATTSDKVPPQILALVPAGAQIINQQYMKIQGDVTVSFIAERKSGLLSGTMTRFTFKLSSYDKNGYVWKMVAPGTRQDIETNSQRTEHSMSLTGDNSMISQPEVTPYPWGKGVTQKTRFYGEDRPDFYSYHSYYWGVVGTNVFSLEVEEIPDRADADKWAKSVADATANISPSALSR